MRKFLLVVLATLASGLFTSAAYAVGDVYAVDVRAVSNRLIRFPVNAPALNILNAAPNVYDGFAMDFDPSGTTLYGITFTSVAGAPHNFGTISQTTGVHTTIAPISGPAPAETNWADLMIAPNGDFWALAVSGAPPAAVNRIYRINPVTGVATLSSTLNLVAGTVIDMAVDANGVFYGNDFTRDVLVRIDPITGVTTDIGPTGFNASFAQGMDFDFETNDLYATLYTGGGTGQYVRFNLATGAATSLFVTTPWNAEMGMAINSPIPEPATFSLIGLAGLGLLARRRRA
jgi:hypothetical protein